MIDLRTTAEIRAAEAVPLAVLPDGALMRRAATALEVACAEILEAAGAPATGSNVVVLVGSGNTGGDALWAAAGLARRGCRVDALTLSDRIHAAVNTQDWLLGETTRDDRILLWVDGDWVDGDRELYVVAGMQLWGENRITLEPRLSPVDIERLNTIRPSVLALYGQSMPGVIDFWSSIPAVNRATPPQCYDFPWAPNPASAFTVTQGHACLTRLTWGDE